MENNGKSKWVSASDVGRAAYCPHYLELKKQGAKPSKQAIAARAQGNASHNALNRQAEDGRCFIASHLYGIDDDRTSLLRSYRDEKLVNSYLGNLFIRIYYVFSPGLVSICRRVPFLNNILKYIVDYLVSRLQRRKSHD